MQAPYAVVSVNLAVTGNAIPVTVLANAKITFVGVLSAPAGVSLGLKFGTGGDVVPLTDNWVGIRFAEPHDQGLYINNTVVQAGTVELLVGFFQPCAS